MLQWHNIQTLCGRTFSEKLPKIPLFGPSLIHNLRLLVTSFSTCGTENSLAEINLEITGGGKGL